MCQQSIQSLDGHQKYVWRQAKKYRFAHNPVWLFRDEMGDNEASCTWEPFVWYLHVPLIPGHEGGHAARKQNMANQLTYFPLPGCAT